MHYDFGAAFEFLTIAGAISGALVVGLIWAAVSIF